MNITKRLLFSAAVLIFFATTISAFAESNLLNVTEYQDEAARAAHRDELATVKLRGKINHAGSPDYHAVVAGVQVWLAEYPASKNLKIYSDDKGWWTMNILKRKGVELKVSPVYAKTGWITTKSNVITVTDADDLDLGIQYVNPLAYRLLIKPIMEMLLKKIVPAGADSTLNNAMVVTVGKSWASLHDDRLPHGDPGATLNAIDGAIGPVYFDERVRPNISYTRTSVDGGVAWLNVPKGTHVLKAKKEGVKYRDVEFAVTAEDARDGVVLYIASPPDGVQGDNSSPPGKN